MRNVWMPLLLALPLAAYPDPVTVTLADRDIAVPPPPGFVDAGEFADDRQHAWREADALAAVFLPAGDVETLSAGGEATSGAFFAIQVMPAQAQARYTQDDFVMLKDMFRQEWADDVARFGMDPDDAPDLIRHSMLMLMHAEVDQQVTEMFPLPLLVDNEHAIGSGHVFVQRGPGDAPGQLAVELSSVSFIFVRDRVLVASGEMPYHDETDLGRVSAQLEGWAGRIVEANPPKLADRIPRVPAAVYWAFAALLVTLMAMRMFWYRKDMRKLILLLPFLLVACGETPESDAAREARERAMSQQLHAIFDAWFEESLQLNPLRATFLGDHRFNNRFPNTIGPDHRAKSLAMEERYLAMLDEIDRRKLSENDLISYDMFRYDREMAIEAAEFPTYLTPVDQFRSMPNTFAQLGSGNGAQPFRTYTDYSNFLARIDGFIEWMAQAEENMREGVERGYVLPKVLVERVLPQLEAQIVDDPEDSLFWRPVAAMPGDLGALEEEDVDRERLAEAYREAIMDKLVPAYRALHDFMRDDYLPHARDEVGLNALPGGEARYQYLVRRMTTTDLAAAEIHEIGLAEVERIHGEMRGVMEDVGFEGTLHEFFEYTMSDPQFFYEDGEDLVQGYRDLQEVIDLLLPELFEIFPRANYEVRAVEPYRERSAADASYMRPSADGSRPGIFYVNTYEIGSRPKWAMESLSLHEASPGHHFQISIQQENEVLPEFRRYGSYTAYVEGWALYAETLGKELGIYDDPYQYFGALNGELWRAIRLVVDTGLHHHGWTREDVLEYMYENSATGEARAVAETERYIAIPAQALAYKVGELKISELRQRAEAELGDRFDVRAFHTEVLRHGALPLDVLEARIDRWIAAH